MSAHGVDFRMSAADAMPRAPRPPSENARMIAGVDADWLAAVLTRFSEVVGAEDRTLAEDKRLAKHYQRMNYAAGLLIKELPRFRPLPGDISINLMLPANATPCLMGLDPAFHFDSKQPAARKHTRLLGGPKDVHRRTARSRSKRSTQ
jgi:hypothetical protein